jgi:hypothetical protein
VLPSRAFRSPLGAFIRSPLGVLGSGVGGAIAFAMSDTIEVTLEVDDVRLRRRAPGDVIAADAPIPFTKVLVFDEALTRPTDATFGFANAYPRLRLVSITPLPVGVLGPVDFVDKTTFLDTGNSANVPLIVYPTWEQRSSADQLTPTFSLIGDTATISFDTDATAYRAIIGAGHQESGGVLFRYDRGPTPMFAAIEYPTFTVPPPISFHTSTVEVIGRLVIKRIP